MAARVTVLDGASVIGGTKILIESGKNQLLCDFGTNYTLWNRYFEEYLKPRGSYGLVDVASLGLLPPMTDLYRPDFIPTAVPVRWKRQLPVSLKNAKPEGLVVSHAHLDHCGHVSFLRQDMQVFGGLTTALMMKAIQDQSRTDLEGDICYAVPREGENGLIRSMHWKNNPATQRQFVVPSGSKITTDIATFWAQALGGRSIVTRAIQLANTFCGIPVRLFPVDHSIPGATAVGFQTESGWLVYTGDVRRHGAGGKNTEKFMQEAAALKPAMLFCEGTRANREDTEVTTEENVATNLLTAISKTEGLVVADFGSRNVERLETFRNVAQQCKRLLIVMPKDVHLLRAAFLGSSSVVDPLTDPVVRVYQEAKVKETPSLRFIYQQFQGKLMQAADISRAQDQCIVCFSFWDVNELIEIQPVPNSLYIYSSSEAYSEEQCADMLRLRAWLDHFGMKSLGIPDPDTGKPAKDESGFHASGHAPASDIAEIIEAIAPKTLVPVHTESPGWFVERFSKQCNVIVPQELNSIAM